MDKFEKFDKFEKLDRKVEETIREVETMDRKRFYKNGFVYAGVLALVLNLIIETLGRFPTVGIFGGLKFMVSSPLVFLYNALIIFATLVFATLVKRRFFAFSIISLFWLVIGIANGVILTQRMTPFTVKDLSNLGDGLTIVTTYLSKGEIVLAGIAIVVLIGLVVLLFIKGQAEKRRCEEKTQSGSGYHGCCFYNDFYDSGSQCRGRGNILRKSCLCVPGLRCSILFYQYLAEYRYKQTERVQ